MLESNLGAISEIGRPAVLSRKPLHALEHRPWGRKDRLEDGGAAIGIAPLA
jgi:hypothetical protein